MKKTHDVANQISGWVIERLNVRAYTVPTDSPEQDGTFDWDATTLVLVTLQCSGQLGVGYSYTDKAAAMLIHHVFRDCVEGRDPMHVPAIWQTMTDKVRNLGRPGLGMMAIAAVDHALWDLKARLLGISLPRLWGAHRSSIPAYGSGGFTNYDERRLKSQLAGWAEAGFTSVKIKVGRETDRDPSRLQWARAAIGSDIALMVDANGAYERKQAIELLPLWERHQVVWLEEPVSSDDLIGLNDLRARSTGCLRIAAGEYGWDADYFARMLQARAVDTLQIDATRCGGFTGFLQAASVASVARVPISAHCAPHLHAHVCSTVDQLAHVEYFHDHARIEAMFFDGLPKLENGSLSLDPHRPGLGLEVKWNDIAKYSVAS